MTQNDVRTGPRRRKDAEVIDEDNDDDWIW